MQCHFKLVEWMLILHKERKNIEFQVLQYLTEHRTLWFLISVVMVTEWWSLKLSHGKYLVQVNNAEPPTSRFITFSGSIVLESSQSIIHLVKVANQHTIKAKLSAVIQLRQNLAWKFWSQDIEYCRFLILSKFLIPRSNNFASNFIFPNSLHLSEK